MQKNSFFKIFLCLFLFLNITQIGFAQKDENGWDWGSDPNEARQKWAFFDDNITHLGVLDESNIEPLNWLLENAPELSPYLYNNAVKLYDNLAKEAEDAEQQLAYQEKVLEMYDLKIKYFGDEAYISNLKGYAIPDAWFENPEKYKEMFELYSKIINLNGSETYDYNVYLYMYLACSMKEMGELNDEEILGIYNTNLTIAEKNIANAEDEEIAASWEETKIFIEEQLETGCIEVDCQMLVETYRPKFEADPKNLEQNKKILKLLASGQCFDEQFLLDVAVQLYELEPTDSRAKVIALIYQKQGNEAKYIEYISKMSDPKELANVYLRMAQSAGNKSQARNFALKAAEYGETAIAYTLIGNLYMRSGRDCYNENPVKARACYLAAYDMYALAGNGSGMARAQEQFPSGEDIFTYGMDLGQSINVGCWIGGTTTLRKR